jgi:diacylglycerol kinase (ATP)
MAQTASSLGDNLGMKPADPHATHSANPQKSRSGINRILHASGYSLEGLRAGWHETAFRQEAILAILMLPAAFWLGRTWVEVALLAAVVALVLITELLNTGIETAIDRIGPEWHALSKRAKDMGSAAVMLSLVLCAAVWAAAVYSRFVA